MQNIDIIETSDAPAAIGPYSQAVVVEKTVYVSGQIALKPGSADLVGRTAAEQTSQVLQNLGAILKKVGASFESVAKCTIYLTDMADFQAVNAEYEKVFSRHKPARATVAVRELPKKALVEIDAIAQIF